MVTVATTVGSVRPTLKDLARPVEASAAVLFRLSTPVVLAVTALGTSCLLRNGTATKMGDAPEKSVMVKIVVPDKIGITISGKSMADLAAVSDGTDKNKSSESVVSLE